MNDRRGQLWRTRYGKAWFVLASSDADGAGGLTRHEILWLDVGDDADSYPCAGRCTSSLENSFMAWERWWERVL